MKLKLTLLLVLVAISSQLAMSQMITRVESVQSLYVELFDNNKFLGTATGFIFKSKSQNYLITNWHVVTNKKPADKSWINPNFQISPNRIVIVHNAKTLGKYSIRSETLTDSNLKPMFKEYSIGSEMLDVVAIPLKDTIGDIRFYPVHFSTEMDSLLLQPTDRLFVLGFPKGVKSAPFMPIWKSGLIASEPEINQENKPLIWLDIASYGGMSGSPVYLITDKVNYKNGNVMNLMGGSKSYFMGVFSHGQDLINVGALWKSNYLKSIFDSLP